MPTPPPNQHAEYQHTPWTVRGWLAQAMLYTASRLGVTRHDPVQQPDDNSSIGSGEPVGKDEFYRTQSHPYDGSSIGSSARSSIRSRDSYTSGHSYQNELSPGSRQFSDPIHDVEERAGNYHAEQETRITSRNDIQIEHSSVAQQIPDTFLDVEVHAGNYNTRQANRINTNPINMQVEIRGRLEEQGEATDPTLPSASLTKSFWNGLFTIFISLLATIRLNPKSVMETMEQAWLSLKNLILRLAPERLTKFAEKCKLEKAIEPIDFGIVLAFFISLVTQNLGLGADSSFLIGSSSTLVLAQIAMLIIEIYKDICEIRRQPISTVIREKSASELCTILAKKILLYGGVLALSISQVQIIVMNYYMYPFPGAYRLFLFGLLLILFYLALIHWEVLIDRSCIPLVVIWFCSIISSSILVCIICFVLPTSNPRTPASIWFTIIFDALIYAISGPHNQAHLRMVSLFSAPCVSIMMLCIDLSWYEGMIERFNL